MKVVNRDIYLNKLINKRENGLIKIITGIRRSGKSYLLDPLFTDYLKSTLCHHKAISWKSCV